MEILTYNTPGLLFPTISLLMLAYTNRFLGRATLVRDLIARYRESQDPRLKPQIENLRQRIELLRHSQGLGVLSLSFCTISLCALFLESQTGAGIAFSVALLLMLISLGFSMREIFLSVRALNIKLDHLLA